MDFNFPPYTTGIPLCQFMAQKCVRLSLSSRI